MTLNPLLNLNPETSYSLGPDLPPDQAIGIAEGRLNPFTKESFEKEVFIDNVEYEPNIRISLPGGYTKNKSGHSRAVLKKSNVATENQKKKFKAFFKIDDSISVFSKNENEYSNRDNSNAKILIDGMIVNPVHELRHSNSIREAERNSKIKTPKIFKCLENQEGIKMIIDSSNSKFNSKTTSSISTFEISDGNEQVSGTSSYFNNSENETMINPVPDSKNVAGEVKLEKRSLFEIFNGKGQKRLGMRR